MQIRWLLRRRLKIHSEERCFTFHRENISGFSYFIQKNTISSPLVRFNGVDIFCEQKLAN